MRILHLYPDLNLTCGVSKIIYLICKKATKHSHFVMTLRGDGIEKFIKSNIEVEHYPCDRKSFIGTFKILFKLIIYCRIKKIAIIHSHHRYFDLLSFIISKLLSIQTITSVQSKVYGYKLLSYNSKKIIAVSDCIKKHLQNEFKLEHSKIVLIRNFVDESEALSVRSNSEIRKELNISIKQHVIGFIGRNSIKEKGIDILLQAFQKISRGFKDIVMIMVGKGEDDEYIYKTIKKYNLNIIVLGPKENIFNYYTICDILVFPSRVEPFSVGLLEAGLMKKPVIASNVDGIPELIENEKNGILFKSGNILQLSEQIQRLIQNKYLCERLGNNLHQKVLNNYTYNLIIPQYEKLYSCLD